MTCEAGSRVRGSRGVVVFCRAGLFDLMCSTLPGEASSADCARYCKISTRERHCRHCLCAGCDFCAASAMPLQSWSAPTRAQRLASRAAVDGLRENFLDATRGVVLRVWECSLAGCASDAGGEDRASNAYVERCVRDEMAAEIGAARPASLLRVDLPAAIYAGGRCVDPAAGTIEESFYPVPRTNDPRGLQDEHGWRRAGFSGHHVTQAGIGWVFSALPAAHRGVAFAHDAWAYDPRVGSRPQGSDLAPGRACRDGSSEQSSKQGGDQSNDPLRGGRDRGGRVGDGRSQRERSERYAVARRASQSGDTISWSASSGLHVMQRKAAAHKWGFINTSWNCMHVDWEAAFSEQRAYATMLANTRSSAGGSGNAGGSGGGGSGGGGGGDSGGGVSTGLPEQLPELPELPECGPWGALYNQVHVATCLSLPSPTSSPLLATSFLLPSLPLFLQSGTRLVEPQQRASALLCQ